MGTARGVYCLTPSRGQTWAVRKVHRETSGDCFQERDLLVSYLAGVCVGSPAARPPFGLRGLGDFGTPRSSPDNWLDPGPWQEEATPSLRRRHSPRTAPFAPGLRGGRGQPRPAGPLFVPRPAGSSCTARDPPRRDAGREGTSPLGASSCSHPGALPGSSVPHAGSWLFPPTWESSGFGEKSSQSPASPCCLAPVAQGSERTVEMSPPG